MTLPRDLYETLLTEALRQRIDRLGVLGLPSVEPLRDAKADDRRALHFTRIVER